MRGLLSNFSLALKIALFVGAAFTAVALAVAAGFRRAGRPALKPASRVLAFGSAIVIAVATGMPQEFPFVRQGIGDLELALGKGGLSDWRVILEDPNSLAAVLLVANVVLYMPLAFFATIGWPGRSGRVLLGCLFLSVVVEAAQLIVLGRVASLDDVLLNMGGAIVGLVIGLPVAGAARRR